MLNIDEVYYQENLVTVDPYQFNAILFDLARLEFSNFFDQDTVYTDKPFLSILSKGRYMLVLPDCSDRRCFAPRVDYDLWVEFEKRNPEGAKPVLRP